MRESSPFVDNEAQWTRKETGVPGIEEGIIYLLEEKCNIRTNLKRETA
jgi:hypothetical protein